MKVNFNIVSVLVLVVFVDQMLLPMFHLGSVPVKPSYAILVGLLLLPTKFRTDQARLFFRALALPLIGLAVATLLGALFLAAVKGLPTSDETFRSILVYVMCLGGAKLGLLAYEFPTKQVLKILYLVLGLVAILVFFAESFPSIAKLWWGSEELIAERIKQNKLRPTPFGDGSPIRINILFLGVTLMHVFNIYRVKWKWILIVSVLVTNIVLGSRNQLVAFGLIAAVLIFDDLKLAKRASRGVFSLLILSLLLPIGLSLLSQIEVFEKTIERVSMLTEIFETQGTRQTSNILRPLLMWDLFIQRFTFSPFIGSGFGTLPKAPFDYLHYHNDWLVVTATSGLLGLSFFLMLVVRLWKRVGWIAVLPFFLPGLTNSFIWAIPSMLVFFILMGIIVTKRAQFEELDESEQSYQEINNETEPQPISE